MWGNNHIKVNFVMYIRYPFNMVGNNVESLNVMSYNNINNNITNICLCNSFLNVIHICLAFSYTVFINGLTLDIKWLGGLYSQLKFLT